MDASFMTRSVNEGFSAAKRSATRFCRWRCSNQLAVLDETDSGLDIDALRVVANGVNQLLTPDNAIIVVTHYQRLLNYIVPDFVHVLAGGRIAREGGKELALNSNRRATTGSRRQTTEKERGAGAEEWLPNSSNQKTVIKRRFAACVSFHRRCRGLSSCAAARWTFRAVGFSVGSRGRLEYTNLATLAKENFVPATASTESVDVSGFAYPETEGAHLVVVNGFLREDLSQKSGLGDVAVDLFSAAADARYNKIIRKYLARNAGYHNNGLTA